MFGGGAAAHQDTYIDPVRNALSWKPIDIGGGGFQTGIQIANDGVMVAHNDTHGGHVWNPTAPAPSGLTGIWQQVCAADRMPPEFVTNAMQRGFECPEIVVAPSNSNYMYMIYRVAEDYQVMTLYASTNKGVTWTRCDNFNTAWFTVPPAGNDWRASGPKIVVDPADPLTVLIGCRNNFMVRTSDGSASFTQITGVPAPLKDQGETTPGANDGESMGCLGLQISRSNSNIAFACSSGNGVYKTTTGLGGTWSKLTSGTGPTHVRTCALDSATGFYYAVDFDTHNLWRHNGTTWSQVITDGQVSSVACDMHSSGHIMASSYDARLAECFSNGTFSGWSNTDSFGSPPVTSSAGDCPAQSVVWDVQTETLQFDPVVTGKLWCTGTQGIFYASPGTISTASNFTWTSQVRGIEQMVANVIIVPIGSSVPIGGVWDMNAFYFDELDRYITHKNTGRIFAATWDMCCAASDPSFVIQVADEWFAGQRNDQTYSHDYGRTWNTWDAPSGVITENGNIAAATPTNWVCVLSQGTAPWVTQDAGVTWTQISVSGITDWSSMRPYGFDTATHQIVADPVNIGEFTIHVWDQGFIKSTDGGVTWTLYPNSSVVSSFAPGRNIFAVPGKAGHRLFTSGTGGSPPAGSNSPFWSTDGGQTWTQILNIVNVGAIGTGKAATGQSYPTISMTGFTKATSSGSQTITKGTKNFVLSGAPANIAVGTPVHLYDGGSGYLMGLATGWNPATNTLTVNAVTIVTGSGSSSSWDVWMYGIWRSDTGPKATMDWYQIGVYPFNNMDTIECMCGDMGTFGLTYVGFGGSSYGQLH